MKKHIGILFVLFTSLFSGCASQGPEGPVGPQGEQGIPGQNGVNGKDGLTPYIGTNGNWWIGENDTGVKANNFEPVDFSKYENKIFYEYNFESEFNKGKIVRYKFEETDENYYQVPDRDYFMSIREYDWFSSQIKINGSIMTACWNNGYTEDPVEYTSTSRAFMYWEEVQDYGIVLAGTRYFDDYDVDELVFGDDLIVWSSQHVYYSEEYLVSKGLEFFDYDEVIDETKLVLVD